MSPMMGSVLIAFVTLLVLDLLWLTLVMKALFKSALGNVLLDQPRLIPAAIFYVVYTLGISYFAIAPATTATGALIRGALLGFVCYVTYDFTNLATLRPWNWTLALMDVAWGTAVTAIAASAGSWWLRR